MIRNHRKVLFTQGLAGDVNSKVNLVNTQVIKVKNVAFIEQLQYTYGNMLRPLPADVHHQIQLMLW